jgi:hypothetical protein
LNALSDGYGRMMPELGCRVTCSMCFVDFCAIVLHARPPPFQPRRVADVVIAALALVALALAQRVHHHDARAMRAGVRVRLEVALHAGRQRRRHVTLVDLEMPEPTRQTVCDQQGHGNPPVKGKSAA